MIQFTENDVVRLLPMTAAIESLRRAFTAYGNGEAQNQPRRRLILPTGAVLHSMAAAFGGYFGTKIYSTHPKHGAHFTFLLYDAATARPLAQLEANHLGQIRTGAASGLAADLLAPEKPLNVTVIGSGFQARTQLEAVKTVRTVSRVRVWSRSQTRREAFAAATGSDVATSAEQACEGADVIITATHSKDPVVRADAISQNALILAMGSNIANRHEVPAEVVERARIVVDDVEQCRIEAGDLLLANIDWNVVEPLSEIVKANTKAGGDRRLTLFKSVGIALEDVAVAAYIYEATPARSSADPSRATR
jgi:ornithine cyclodeaminase/alanine dehydrogenase-like protein (mu-crystallin family)